jgi:hypothetical protein
MMTIFFILDLSDKVVLMLNEFGAEAHIALSAPQLVEAKVRARHPLQNRMQMKRASIVLP